MRGYTHAAAGALAGALVGHCTGVPAGGAAALGALAALLPDIDHPGSIIGRRLRPASVLLEVAAGHRTITHTVWFCLGLGILAGFAGRMFHCSFGQIIYSAPTWVWFCTAVLGAMSHLLLDGLTRSGVEPFSPVLAISIRGPLRTGSVFELPITGALLLALYRVL
ncbi:MAG: metal-dependent hydrolase [Bacillota bacterium]|jgi:inner membrane protein|nr:metal-dependent hydrolase [Bacillota bacterium]